MMKGKKFKGHFRNLGAPPLLSQAQGSRRHDGFGKYVRAQSMGSLPRVASGLFAASRYRAVGRIHQASDGVGEDVEDMKSRERDSLEAV